MNKSHRHGAAIAAPLILLMFASCASTSSDRALQEKLRFLQFSEGSDPEAESVAQKVMERVENLRKLQFKNPVRKAFMTRERLGQFLEMESQNSHDEDSERSDQISFELFGLLKSGQNLVQCAKGLQTQQIAGFYDAEVKALFLVNDHEPANGAQEVENDQETMAHELCHALDDQYYDLNAIDKALEDADPGNNDRQFAWASVCEGSAMILTIQFFADGFDIADVVNNKINKNEFSDHDDGANNPDGEPEGHSRIAGEISRNSDDDMRDFPPILVRSLTDRYFSGAAFLTKGKGLFSKAEAADLDIAFENPPLSSEQVLHPEKYWDPSQRDDPRKVIINNRGIIDILGKDWRKLGEGNLGELGIAVLTDETEAEDLNGDSPMESFMSMGRTTLESEGWDGDLYQTFERPGGAMMMVWVSVWDRALDARQMNANLKHGDGVTVVSRISGDTLVAVFGRGVGPNEMDRVAGTVLASVRTEELPALKLGN